MVIRLFLSFIIFNCSVFSFCQTEEQRKYAIENFEEFKSFIFSSVNDEPLLTHFHSKDIYIDLYLDTPDKLLYKNKLSLRFRKRILDSTNAKSKYNYAFQLKNEMDTLNAIRMEVEEKELDFYFVKSDNGWIPLTNVLDTIFLHFENYSESHSSTTIQNAISLIESWIQIKTNAPIAPFQKLLHLGIKSNDIQKLAPIVFAKSIRYRSHVYSVYDSKMPLEKNKVMIDKLPLFFQVNSEYNWLLESSLDSTVFFKTVGNSTINASILEYEVENKYYLTNIGSEILSAYGNFLTVNFALSLKTDSKYRQAIKMFDKQKL